MTPDERRKLIDSALEGVISEADFLRLEAELTIDPAARRDYYDQVALSLLLEAEAAESPQAPECKNVLSLESSASRRRSRGAFAALASLAAALMVIIAMQFRERTAPPLSIAPERFAGGSNEEHAENRASGFAVISGQADAIWTDGRSLADGSLVSTGELLLQSGFVQLELFSGVVLVVEGEARFSVLSPMEVAVSRGKVRARVPDPAQGFRILTDVGEVVDLGTEFAVNVTEAGSEIHVLDGEIDWHPRGSPSQRMEQGEATRLTNDRRPVRIAAVADEFVGPRELKERLRAIQESKLKRWRRDSEELRGDPRLVAYFQTAPDGLAARRLPNLASGAGAGGSEGAVVAAAAAADRWGRSESALDFSPAGSRVRLTIPGDHRSLTLLCWVKINSLDRLYNSLFLTDGHDQHEPHWQIMNDGRLFFSVKKYENAEGRRDKHIFYSAAVWTPSLSGRWMMVATVYDVDRKLVTHYLNGESLSSEAIPDEYLVDQIRIGAASLGNWSEPAYRKDPGFAVRNLNGSMDEFALFSAALSADEVRRLYEAGKP